MTRSQRPRRDVLLSDLVLAAAPVVALAMGVYGLWGSVSVPTPTDVVRVSVSIRASDGAPRGQPEGMGSRARVPTARKVRRLNAATSPRRSLPAPPAAASSGARSDASPDLPPSSDAAADPLNPPAESEQGATADDGGLAGEGADARQGEALDESAQIATDAYRASLRDWLSSRFSMSGSGLPISVLSTHRIATTLEIDDERAIVRITVEPSGVPEFDRAAQRSLDALKGQQLPGTPPGYPGPLQRRIRVTFVCPMGSCT